MTTSESVLTKCFEKTEALDLLCSFSFKLVNVGEEVLVFYSDPQSFNSLVDMMQSERERLDQSGPLLYHINLVELLACCTEGKNVYTEIKCHSLLPLDDIVRVVTHPDCIPEVRRCGDKLLFQPEGWGRGCRDNTSLVPLAVEIRGSGRLFPGNAITDRSKVSVIAMIHTVLPRT